MPTLAILLILFYQRPGLKTRAGPDKFRYTSIQFIRIYLTFPILLGR